MVDWVDAIEVDEPIVDAVEWLDAVDDTVDRAGDVVDRVGDAAVGAPGLGWVAQ